MAEHTRLWSVAAGLAVLAAAAALYATAPREGDFWWSDAPRHAMNGAFILDLLRDLPFDAPKQYAFDYYAKYPALTVLFYPPWFYVTEALFFAVGGVSHAVAQLAVAAHYAALGLGAFALARRYLTPPFALMAALALMLAPEVTLWGRQVMLEIPAFAYAVWSAVLVLDYGEGRRGPMALLGSLFLLLLALYTKLSLVFLLPVYAATLLAAARLEVFRRREIYVAGALFAIGMVPLAAVTLMFGQANVQSVAGVADAVAPRWSIAGWTWYLARLPEQAGWPLLALAAAGAGLMLFRPQGGGSARAWLLVAWLLAGYAFFSLIDLKEARHSLYLLLPLVVWAGTALERLPVRGVGLGLAGLLVAYMAASALRIGPEVPRVAGYREAVDHVARHAPKDSVVLFSGKRDGSFTFNMRERPDRRDLSVLRADKLLLRVAVRRELGVEQRAYDEAEIARMIDEAGVHYVVAQRDFWTDLEVMARLQAVLTSDHFEEVARIPVRSTRVEEDKEVRIYRNRGEVAREPKRPDLELPIIDRTIRGEGSGG